MKNDRLINNIILGLAIILAVLALVIGLMVKEELSGIKASLEEELKAQLTQQIDASEQNTETRQNKLEEIINELVEQAENECRDVNVRSIAHRGASSYAPENTLPAFQLAKELGFSCVETDIRFTRDGIPVCLHDGSIDRTSNGTGDLGNLTLEEVRQYDFGAWKDSRYAGTVIPTFEEFLLLCKNIGLHPYIEMKEGTSEQVRNLVDTVNNYGMKGKVTWISFDISLLATVRWYDDGARLGYLVSEFYPSVVTAISGLRSGKNEVFLNSCINNSWVVEECRKTKLPLEIWTINKEWQMEEMDPYITGVTSNCLIYGRYLYEKEMAAGYSSQNR